MRKKYFLKIMLMTLLPFVSLQSQALSSWLTDVKIDAVHVYNPTTFTMKLVDLNGNPITSGAGGGCFAIYGKFWVSISPDPEQYLTGVNDREYFKMLYSIASAAFFSGSTIDVNLTYDSSGGCFVSAIQVNAS